MRLPPIRWAHVTTQIESQAMLTVLQQARCRAGCILALHQCRGTDSNYGDICGVMHHQFDRSVGDAGNRFPTDAALVRFERGRRLDADGLRRPGLS